MDSSPARMPEYAQAVVDGWTEAELLRLHLHELPRSLMGLDRKRRIELLAERPPMTGTPWDGVRQDGGAGQTGVGLELESGARLSAGLLRVEAQGRMLGLHTATARRWTDGRRWRCRNYSPTGTGGGATAARVRPSSRWSSC